MFGSFPVKSKLTLQGPKCSFSILSRWYLGVVSLGPIRTEWICEEQHAAISWVVFAGIEDER